MSSPQTFENLIKKQGGKIKPHTTKHKLLTRLLASHIDYKSLLLMTVLTLSFLALIIILPEIYKTPLFGIFSDFIGSTATFIGIMSITYSAYKASGILFIISIIHIMSWSCIVALLTMSSNIEQINDQFIAYSQAQYGGGYIGDQLAAILIRGSSSMLGAVHPAIILPTAFMLLSSILLGNPIARLFSLLNLLIPTEKTKKYQKTVTSKSKPKSQIKQADLISVLELYGIKATISGEPLVGPSITKYKLLLPRGAKTSNFEKHNKDIARDLKLKKITIDTAGDGDGTINIETENKERKIVRLTTLLNNPQYLSSPRRTAILGVDASNSNNIILRDIHNMPHLLVAGTTGGGKSVGLNAILMSLIYRNTPEELQLILLDPKQVELTPYNSLPHMLLPVETNPKNMPTILLRAIAEMEYRYALMAANAVRNIDELNKKIKKGQVVNPLYSYVFSGDKTHDVEAFKYKPFSITKQQQIQSFIPDIIIVADEFADMMKIEGKEIERLIDTLAAKARAANIVLVLATQRPTVNVITGNIKTNIPTRISFTVPTSTDSMTILGRKDAKNLIGKGDSYLMEPNSDKLLRIQSPLSSDSEVNQFIKRQ